MVVQDKSIFPRNRHTAINNPAQRRSIIKQYMKSLVNALCLDSIGISTIDVGPISLIVASTVFITFCISLKAISMVFYSNFSFRNILTAFMSELALIVGYFLVAGIVLKSVIDNNRGYSIWKYSYASIFSLVYLPVYFIISFFISGNTLEFIALICFVSVSQYILKEAVMNGVNFASTKRMLLYSLSVICLQFGYFSISTELFFRS